MLSGATCLVSNGNNISSRASPTMKDRQILKRDKRHRPVLVFCFARFAAYDVKGRQVATGNGASFPWQQYHFNVKTWWPNFVAPYSTDNRSKQTFSRKVIFWMHYFWMRSKLMKDFKFLCPLMSLSMGTYERRFRRAFFIKSSIFQRNHRFSQSRIRTFLDPFLTFFLSSTLISTFQVWLWIKWLIIFIFNNFFFILLVTFFFSG